MDLLCAVCLDSKSKEILFFTSSSFHELLFLLLHTRVAFCLPSKPVHTKTNKLLPVPTTTQLSFFPSLSFLLPLTIPSNFFFSSINQLVKSKIHWDDFIISLFSLSVCLSLSHAIAAKIPFVIESYFFSSLKKN